MGLAHHTSAIGKWHIHSWPHDIGFDDYVIPRMNHAHSGQPFSENGGPEFVPAGYSVDYECDRVADLLRRRSRTAEPFFLYYNISPPHCPMSDGPERYLTMYRPEEIPIRANVDLSKRLPEQDHWFKVYRWDYRYYNFHLPYTEVLPADFDLRRVIAEYYGMTTWVDDAIGRMLATLDATGLADDTVVIFSSDHGDYLGSHGRVQKGDLHEESIRIPLLLRWPAALRHGTVIRPPGHGSGRRHAHRAGTAWPARPGPSTAAISRPSSAANVPPSTTTRLWWRPDGVSALTPTLLYGLRSAAAPAALAAAPHYVWDLAADPFELHNLAGSSELPEVTRDLDRRLRDWHAHTPWLATT